MEVNVFDYGLITEREQANFAFTCVSERAVGFGKLFSDGTYPILLADGDDNDKFYGRLLRCDEAVVAQLAKQWPDYQVTNVPAYTASGTYDAVALTKTKAQLKNCIYLDYPEWSKK